MSFLVLLQYFSYAASPLAAVLAYFHIMGKKEQEEAIRNKFNDEYHPEITDCKAKLHFCKVGVKEKTLKTGEMKSILNTSLVYFRVGVSFNSISTTLCDKVFSTSWSNNW